MSSGTELVQSFDVYQSLEASLSYTFHNGTLWHSWVGNTQQGDHVVGQVFADVFDTQWLGAVSLSNNPSKSAAQIPRLITNDLGHTLAVWYQYDNGLVNLYASIRTNGQWSTPLSIAPTRRNNYNSHIRQSARLTEFQFAAKGGGFLVAWVDSTRKYVREYDGSDWLAAQQIETGIGYFTTRILLEPKIFVENNQYRVLWLENDADNNEFDLYSATKVDSKWTMESVLSIADPEPIPSGEAIFSISAANNATYLISFSRYGDTLTVSNVYARIFRDNQWITELQKLNVNDNNDSSSHKSVGFEDGRFAVAWDERPLNFVENASAGVYARIYDPSHENPWLAPQRVTHLAGDVMLVANSNTVAVASIVNFRDINLAIYDTATQTWPNDQSIQYVDLPRLRDWSMAGLGDEFLLIWSYQDTDKHLLQFTRYQNSSWSTIPASQYNIEGNIEAFSPNISVYRDDYALSWAQIDLQNRPAIAVINAQIGGF